MKKFIRSIFYIVAGAISLLMLGVVLWFIGGIFYISLNIGGFLFWGYCLTSVSLIILTEGWEQEIDEGLLVGLFFLWPIVIPYIQIKALQKYAFEEQ